MTLVFQVCTCISVDRNTFRVAILELCVHAGDSGAPEGAKGARLVVLSRARWQFVCLCVRTKRIR